MDSLPLGSSVQIQQTQVREHEVKRVLQAARLGTSQTWTWCDPRDKMPKDTCVGKPRALVQKRGMRLHTHRGRGNIDDANQVPHTKNPCTYRTLHVDGACREGQKKRWCAVVCWFGGGILPWVWVCGMGVLDYREVSR